MGVSWLLFSVSVSWLLLYLCDSNLSTWRSGLFGFMVEEISVSYDRNGMVVQFIGGSESM